MLQMLWHLCQSSGFRLQLWLKGFTDLSIWIELDPSTTDLALISHSKCGDSTTRPLNHISLINFWTYDHNWRKGTLSTTYWNESKQHFIFWFDLQPVLWKNSWKTNLIIYRRKWNVTKLAGGRAKGGSKGCKDC